MKRIATIFLFLSLMLGACAKPQAPAPSAPQTPDATPTPQLVTPDENGMLHIGDTYIEAGDPVDEASVRRFADKLKSLRETYLTDNAVYYALIPDKSYFVRAETADYLDHGAIAEMLSTELDGWDALDLGSLLTLDDYYRTDPHWRQEQLLEVVAALGGMMDFSIDDSAFTPQAREGFVGTYRQKIEDLTPETVCWLTSRYTDAATVDNFEHPEFRAVYDVDRLDTEIAYDLFLSGATPLTVIENPDAGTERELVLFRDSYGSSLAPLLLEAYSKITLVDLRYMLSDLLPDYVDFTGAAVLFLYSDRIINNSLLLK